MKAFRTEVTPDKPDWSISHAGSYMMMGSCFAEHIGDMMTERCFEIDLNPFGVLFNPVSIAGGIQRMISSQEYVVEDLFFYQGLWHSFDHHSRFSGTDPLEVLDSINKRLSSSAVNLRKIKSLFITFGSARVYHYVKTGRVVSNCHKVPAGEFQNQLLRVGDIVRLYSRIFQELWLFNPDLNIVLTVSPVRYWKDGPNGNQISKATLLLAVSEMVEKFDRISYFPAYEVFMDDLRDYRFYGQDMLHPGQSGIDYVWEKFSECYYSNETRSVIAKVEKIIKAKSHIPRNPDTEENQKFINKLEGKIQALKKEFPDLSLDL